MHAFQTSYLRPPSRLSHNKQNLNDLNLQLLPRPLSLQTQNTKHKHNYDIYFPKDSMKKKVFMDQPQNNEVFKGQPILKPQKSYTTLPSCAKTIVESVRKRLSTRQAERNEEIQKKRKNSIGAVAYIPTTLDELKKVVKKR